MGEEDIATITKLFGGFIEAQLATVFDAEGKEIAKEVVNEGAKPPDAPEGGKVKLAPLSRTFSNKTFGYRTITVERPLRNEKGEIVLGTRGKQKGKPQPDASLRDTENVPLSEDAESYFRREVLPYCADICTREWMYLARRNFILPLQRSDNHASHRRQGLLRLARRQGCHRRRWLSLSSDIR